MPFGSKAASRQSTTVVVVNHGNANQAGNQVAVPCLIILNADTTFKVVLENGQPLPEGMHVQQHQIQQQVQQMQQRQRLQRGQLQRQPLRLTAPIEHAAPQGATETQKRKKLLSFWTINRGKI